MHSMSPKQRFKLFATVVMAYALLTACTTWRSVLLHGKLPPAPNRGIIANHELHANVGMGCFNCHEVIQGERVSFVDHDTCMLCHEIPEDSLTEPLKFVGDSSCKKCHTRNDFSVAPKRQLITDEIIFDHEVHVTAEVNCTECHSNPDRPVAKTGVLMKACMECHEGHSLSFSGVATSGLMATSYQANECSVCHTTLTKDTIPTHRNGRRIAHDASTVWKKTHGQESYLDAAYCMQCHEEPDDCMTCHRIMKPDNHTIAWNRKLHGAHASWDSQSCSVCHEEDSCIKCHKNTEPRSHRGSFSAPKNNHCVSCHVPVENSCIMCHESIEHRTANRTPHDAGGGYTGNCAACHPGGIAGTAPHLINPTVGCLACHE